MPDRVTPHFESGWRLFKSHASVFVVSMLLLFLSWVAHGNLVPLGVLFLIAFLFNVAGMALLGIGLIISVPVSLLAIAGFYRSLQPANV
jgi:hypothetical protein